MTVLALQAVQPAIYTKLTGDGVLMGMVSTVYDAPPQQASLPYIVIGAGESIERAQVATIVSECKLEIHVWTKGSGRKTALNILNRLYGLLHQGSLTVSGFTVISMHCERAETSVDSTNDRTLGVLQVTLIVSEP